MVKLAATITMTDQIPMRFSIPLSTAVGVSLAAAFDVVAVASDELELEVEVAEASTVLDEDVEVLEDVLVEVADDVLASGSPSRLSKRV
jgi:hypothetical protein